MRLGGESGELRSGGRVILRFGPWKAESRGEIHRVTIHGIRDRDRFRLAHDADFDLHLRYGRECLVWCDVTMEDDAFMATGEPDRQRGRG